MNASRWDELAQDLGLFFLRVSGGLFLLWVHGLPKLLNYNAQLQVIEAPFLLIAGPGRLALNVRFPGALRYA